MMHLILFDATCPLCCNAVKRIQSWDAKHLFSYAPLESTLADQIFERHRELYQKRCQTWNLVRRLRKFFCLERATIVRAQGASEDKKFAAKPTQPNSKFDTVSGIRQIDSLILIEGFNHHKPRIWLRGRAVMRILWLLGGWRKCIGWMAYLPFGVDGVYRLIARHRHSLKKD